MALIICSECGKEYSDKAIACPNCGNPTHEVSDSGTATVQNTASYALPTSVQANVMYYSQLTNKLASKEQTSGIIWTVIAVLQFIAGFAGVWITLIAALINGYAAYCSFQKAKKVQNLYIGMVDEYEKNLTSILITLIYNVVLGGVIGVAGNIYDLCTRNYVLTNREVFEGLAADSAQKAEEEARKVGKKSVVINYIYDKGAAAAVAFTVDGNSEKYTVSANTPARLYLEQGVHTVTFSYNLKSYPFQFNVSKDGSMTFHGEIWKITRMHK